MHACEVLFELMCVCICEIRHPLLHTKTHTPPTPPASFPLFSHWQAAGFSLPLQKHSPPGSTMATCSASSISQPAPQPSQLQPPRERHTHREITLTNTQFWHLIKDHYSLLQLPHLKFVILSIIPIIYLIFLIITFYSPGFDCCNYTKKKSSGAFNKSFKQTSMLAKHGRENKGDGKILSQTLGKNTYLKPIQTPLLYEYPSHLPILVSL